ncbi:Uncharacterised protein [Streptococcus pneumoniae]|nr:Uncharacterised protein [Streptococcus pneumoniae]COH37591.1 Uncharacterised protein [Streptococcus pneumoniae]
MYLKKRFLTSRRKSKEKALYKESFFYSCSIWTPVCAFTCISANVSSSIVLSDDSTVPSHAPRKPSGMEIIPGLDSGMSGSPVKIAPPAGSHTLGLIDTSTSALIRPVRLPHKAPEGLNRFQKTVNTISGRFALAATANASATRNATFKDCAKIARRIESTDTATEAHLAAFICSFSVASPFLMIWL